MGRARLLATGCRAPAPVRDRATRYWWSLAQDAEDRWVLVSVPDSLPDSELPAFDPTRHEPGRWASEHWPPLGGFPDVADLILAIIRRRRTTTIEGQWDRWAVNAYLDSLPREQREALAQRVSTAEPSGWTTLEELREYQANRQVTGRQAEAVRLVKETAGRLWPRTMTPGRLSQFGTRCGDEVFMVLPHDTWASRAEDAVRRAAADSQTTTGDTVRALATARPFDLSLLD